MPRENVRHDIAVLAALHEHGDVVAADGKAQMVLVDYAQEYRIAARTTYSSALIELENNGVIYKKKRSAFRIDEIGIINLGDYTDEVEDLIAHKSEINLHPLKHHVRSAKSLKPTNAANDLPVHKSNESELQMRIMSQAHRIHELEKVITNMEPYLRQFDVFNYLTRGVFYGTD